MAGGGGWGSARWQEELRRGISQHDSMFITREITRTAVERSLREVSSGTGVTDPDVSAGGQLTLARSTVAPQILHPEQVGSRLRNRCGS